MDTTDQTQAEKAKLCLAEFTQLSCNSLSPTKECSELLGCIHSREAASIYKGWEYLQLLFEEFQTDFPFPLVLVGLLLLLQLIKTINDQHHRA